MTHLLRAGLLACALAAPVLAQNATSVPLTGAVTATAAAPTSGTCTFAAGTAACGPFAPSFGFPIRLLLKGGASFTAYVGTTTGNDCSTVNQLTAGGQPIGYTASADEYVDVPPTSGNVKYCLILTVASGTETYAVRQ